MLDSIIKLITAVIVFAFVLVITYLTTRFIGNYQAKSMHGRNFDVLETYRISPNKYMQIIRAGSRYLVIAVCKDSITMLAELDETEIDVSDTDETKKTMSVPAFSDMFEQMKKIKQDESKGQDKNEENEEIR